MTKYIRYQSGSATRYGILEKDTVHELRGDLFDPAQTGAKHALGEVTLLYPATPSKILAVGLNYRSHLGSRPAPANPEIFYKPVSCLQSPDGPITIPPDAQNVHYEGELVLVIGRRTRHASPEEAAQSIFGVTCGNDVSERDWQDGSASGAPKDLQWWRAKGSDTFGPLGPAIVTGIDFSNLLLTTRLNGETVQRQTTSDLLFPAPEIVSYISRWVTLERGDVIYTGTPGSTKKMSPGDIVEVEIEGIGILRNMVAAA